MYLFCASFALAVDRQLASTRGSGLLPPLFIGSRPLPVPMDASNGDLGVVRFVICIDFHIRAAQLFEVQQQQ